MPGSGCYHETPRPATAALTAPVIAHITGAGIYDLDPRGHAGGQTIAKPLMRKRWDTPLAEIAAKAKCTGLRRAASRPSRQFGGLLGAG
jgi:hypothetical protein